MTATSSKRGPAASVRERDIAEYPVRDISWFGVRRAPDGSRVMQSRRARVAEYAVSRLGQLYDYLAWPAVHIRYAAGMDLSGRYVLDPLATRWGLVAMAYHAAGLNLSGKSVPSLVTPDDLDRRSRHDRERPGPRWPIPWRRRELPVMHDYGQAVTPRVTRIHNAQDLQHQGSLTG